MFVCAKYLRSCQRIFAKFSGELGLDFFDFDGGPDSFVDPGIFSRILYH